MKTVLKVSAVLLVAMLISGSAMAQGVDFNQSIGTVVTQYLYGVGAKLIITAVCGYLFFWGFGHERLLVAGFGVIGALGYWGMGLFLGTAGIT